MASEEYIAWYEAFQVERFRVLIDTIRKYHKPFDTIGIFGASFDYYHVKKAFPSSTVAPYGSLVEPQVIPINELKIIDLNATVNVSEHYDIGICCEVVEHLDRPFGEVLNDLLDICTIVIVQTPNGMSLWNRWHCAVRVSPHQHCAEKLRNPQHTYEYTLKELIEGFPVKEVIARNHFQEPGVIHWLYNRVCNCLPATLRDGFTIVYCRI
jgi:hypothetical protein